MDDMTKQRDGWRALAERPAPVSPVTLPATCPFSCAERACASRCEITSKHSVGACRCAYHLRREPATLPADQEVVCELDCEADEHCVGSCVLPPKHWTGKPAFDPCLCAKHAAPPAPAGDARDVLLREACEFVKLALATLDGERSLNPEAVRAFLARPYVRAALGATTGRGSR